MFSETTEFAHLCRLPQTPSIRVTVLYEDLEAGLRAKALMERAQLGTEWPADIQLEFWRFEWLQERSLRNGALAAARDSGLVIISTGSADPLPGPMERWVASWIEGQEGRAFGLMVLLAAERKRCRKYCSLRDRLQRAAQQKGVDFFCEFAEPQFPAHEPRGRLRRNRRVEFVCLPLSRRSLAAEECL